ncbi:MAG TPA: endonuclease/exonuclease/phosphatase family protein, partial [Kofleriaceae bacterium]|nr:endonuclease/exonuclease/phosphatase family protein [Kofleriaceae bacterium]
MRRLAALALAMLFGPGRDAGSEPAKPSASSFRLMTYNLEFNNPNPKATLDAIVAADPDVALFQEVTPAWRDALVDRLGPRYPYRAFYPGRAGGIGMVSK